MKTRLNPLSLLCIMLSFVLLSSCIVDDPGPLQETERQYNIVDFDRLEMGDAFHIDVQHGSFFEVNVRGDRRNIEHLIVRKEGNTLVIRYRQYRQRRHDTFVSITLPELYAVNFSGASESRVYGFSDVETFDVYLSGASVCQLDVDPIRLDAVVSGASYLNLRGDAVEMYADLSGSSALKAFNLPVIRAEISLSGGSDAEVAVAENLKVVASGASHLIYRGDPALTSDVSGGSAIHRD